MNRTFVTHLRAEIPDPRLAVLHRSAADAEAALAELGVGCADLLVSGIPLSGLTQQARRDLLAGWRRCCVRAGCWWSTSSPARCCPDLRQLFGHVRQEFEPLNVLPAWVFARVLRRRPDPRRSRWPEGPWSCSMPMAARDGILLFCLAVCSSARALRAGARRRRGPAGDGRRPARLLAQQPGRPRCASASGAIRARSPASTSSSPSRGLSPPARDPVRAQGRPGAGGRGGRRRRSTSTSAWPTSSCRCCCGSGAPRGGSGRCSSAARRRRSRSAATCRSSIPTSPVRADLRRDRAAGLPPIRFRRRGRRGARGPLAPVGAVARGPLHDRTAGRC